MARVTAALRQMLGAKRPFSLSGEMPGSNARV